jgi:hypothetical protein
VRLALLALALAGCATSQVFVPAEQAAALQRTLVGEERALRLAFHVTPFFGDATKRLLSPVAPEQLRLLTNPDGTPVNPGRSERVLAPGTTVRITKVEFPSAYVMSERVLFTPRSLAWVYLDVAGTPRQSPPFILVLRPGLSDEAEVRSELERYLSRESPAALLEALPESVRAAVLEKRAVIDMPAEALEMAWGYPERKKLELDGTTKVETWFYADGARRAVLRDGKVTELK